MRTVPFFCLCAVFAVLMPQTGAAERAPRYISLAPSTTEILFALGMDAEIVGVSSYCNYPPQARTKEKVGDFSRPNLERIMSMKPDYIFCTGLEQDPAIERLRQLHIPIYIADPANLQELLATIIDIGERTGRQAEAQKLVLGMRARIDAVREKSRSIVPERRPSVFIEIWHSPLMTAGGGSFIDELVDAAGGRNIANDTIRPYSIFSPEAVIYRNPDCIIMAYMDGAPVGERLKKRVGWERINAVRSGRVYNDINPDMLLRPGPRVAEAVDELYRRFYDSQN